MIDLDTENECRTRLNAIIQKQQSSFNDFLVLLDHRIDHVIQSHATNIVYRACFGTRDTKAILDAEEAKRRDAHARDRPNIEFVHEPFVGHGGFESRTSPDARRPSSTPLDYLFDSSATEGSEDEPAASLRSGLRTLAHAPEPRSALDVSVLQSQIRRVFAETLFSPLSSLIKGTVRSIMSDVVFAEAQQTLARDVPVVLEQCLNAISHASCTRINDRIAFLQQATRDNIACELNLGLAKLRDHKGDDNGNSPRSPPQQAFQSTVRAALMRNASVVSAAAATRAAATATPIHIEGVNDDRPQTPYRIYLDTPDAEDSPTHNNNTTAAASTTKRSRSELKGLSIPLLSSNALLDMTTQLSRDNSVLVMPSRSGGPGAAEGAAHAYPSAMVSRTGSVTSTRHVAGPPPATPRAARLLESGAQLFSGSATIRSAIRANTIASAAHASSGGGPQSVSQAAVQAETLTQYIHREETLWRANDRLHAQLMERYERQDELVKTKVAAATAAANERIEQLSTENKALFEKFKGTEEAVHQLASLAALLTAHLGSSRAHATNVELRCAYLRQQLDNNKGCNSTNIKLDTALRQLESTTTLRESLTTAEEELLRTGRSNTLAPSVATAFEAALPFLQFDLPAPKVMQVEDALIRKVLDYEAIIRENEERKRQVTKLEETMVAMRRRSLRELDSLRVAERERFQALHREYTTTLRRCEGLQNAAMSLAGQLRTARERQSGPHIVLDFAVAGAVQDLCTDLARKLQVRENELLELRATVDGKLASSGPASTSNAEGNPQPQDLGDGSPRAAAKTHIPSAEGGADSAAKDVTPVESGPGPVESEDKDVMVPAMDTLPTRQSTVDSIGHEPAGPIETPRRMSSPLQVPRRWVEADVERVLTCGGSVFCGRSRPSSANFVTRPVAPPSKHQPPPVSPREIYRRQDSSTTCRVGTAEPSSRIVGKGTHHKTSADVSALMEKAAATSHIEQLSAALAVVGARPLSSGPQRASTASAMRPRPPSGRR